MNKDWLKQKFFVCDCGDIRHLMQFAYDKDDPDFIWVSIHLAKHRFFDRVKHAIGYILGRQSKYGEFEEVLLDECAVEELITFLEDYKCLTTSLKSQETASISMMT